MAQENIICRMNYLIIYVYVCMLMRNSSLGDTGKDTSIDDDDNHSILWKIERDIENTFALSHTPDRKPAASILKMTTYSLQDVIGVVEFDPGDNDKTGEYSQCLPKCLCKLRDNNSGYELNINCKQKNTINFEQALPVFMEILSMTIKNNIDKDSMSYPITHLVLENVILRNRTIPSGVCNLIKLHSLSITHSNIKYIDKECIKDMSQLQTLILSNNNIEDLSAGLIDDLNDLNHIDFSHNAIKYLQPHTFTGPNVSTKLKFVDLSWNMLTFIDPWPLALVKHFHVNLEHNLISNFTNEMNWHYDCMMEPLHGVVELAFNNITHITDILHGWGFRPGRDDIRIICMFRDDSLRLDIRRNPYICDCVDFDVYKYIRKTKISEIVDQLICNLPKHLYSEKIISIPLENFECNHENNCPKGCECIERPVDKPFYIRCSATEKHQLPETLPRRKRQYYRYQLEFSKNNISKLTHQPYMEFTSLLDLTENNLAEIDDSAVDGLRHISEIFLDHNGLVTLPASIHNITGDMEDGLPQSITLHGNKWSCDCNALWLKHWMLSLGYRLHNPEGVLCDSPKRVQGRNLLALPDDDFLCGDPPDYMFLSLVALTFFVASVTFILYMGLHEPLIMHIKVWLYHKFDFHPFDKEPYSNQAFAYDVFLSYVPSDSQEAQALKCALEKLNYRVCTQSQNFRPGDDIFNRAASLVAKSKRTICLLSQKFFDCDINVWIMDTTFCDVTLRRRLILLGTRTLSASDSMTISFQISSLLHKFIRQKMILNQSNSMKYLLYHLPLTAMGVLETSQQADITDHNKDDFDTALSISTPLHAVRDDDKPTFDDDDSRIYDVFLSFAHEEYQWTDNLRSELESEGYRLCIHHRDFHTGKKTFDNIGEALDKSKRLLCVISQNFIDSEFCMWEFEMALRMQLAKEHRIIPVMYDKPEEMDLQGQLKQYLDRFTYLERWNPDFDRLLRSDLPKLNAL